MTNEVSEVELSTQDLRAVASYAAESAQEALSIFEESHPGDQRPRVAVEAARTFAEVPSERSCSERARWPRTRLLAAAAGIRIPRMHPHMLRHTFVTTMLDAGVSLRDV